MSQRGFINPEYKPHKDLGEATFSDAEWDTLKANITTYLTDKAFEVAKIVMERRDIELSQEDKNILQSVFEQTSKYRNWEKV